MRYFICLILLLSGLGWSHMRSHATRSEPSVALRQATHTPGTPDTTAAALDFEGDPSLSEATDHLGSIDHGEPQPELLLLFGGFLFMLALGVARIAAKERSHSQSWQQAGDGAVAEAG